jgi:hypothetical protein
LVLAGLSAGGCGDAQAEPFGDPSDVVLARLPPPSTSLVGLDEDGPATNLFRFIPDATLGVDGTIGVLASDPPYLRVFTSDGSFLWSALDHGDGPAESNGPFAIAANSLGYLVLSVGRIHALDYSGTLLFDRTLTRIAAHDVGPGCSTDTWTLYGEGRDRDDDGSVGWLFSLPADGSNPTPVFRDALAQAPQRIARVSLRRVSARLRFDHPYGSDRGLVEHDCASGLTSRMGPTVMDQRFFARSADPRRPPRVESATISEGSVLRKRRYDFPEPVYAGRDFAVDGEPYVPSYRGWFTTHTESGWVSASTPFDAPLFDLLDHTDSIVVVKSSDPVPHIRVVQMSDLRAYLSDLVAHSPR